MSLNYRSQNYKEHGMLLNTKAAKAISHKGIVTS